MGSIRDGLTCTSLLGFVSHETETQYRKGLKAEIKPWLLQASSGPLLALIAIFASRGGLTHGYALFSGIALACAAFMFCLAHSRIQNGRMAVAIVLGIYAATRIVAMMNTALSSKAERFLIGGGFI